MRILSVLHHPLMQYLGAAPFIRSRTAKTKQGLERLHHEAAMGSFFLLSLLGLAFASCFVLLSLLMVWARPIYEGWRLEPYVLDALWKLLLAWLVLHGFCIVHAARGSGRPLPLVNWLGSMPWVQGTARWTGRVAFSAGLLIAGLAAYSNALVPQSQTPGKVYLVYEDNGIVPRWFFTLGLLPMAREARQLYGDESVRALRITREHLREAFAHGRFVMVASHGQAEGLIAGDNWFAPHDLQPGDVGLQLGYVYLSGCDSGAQAEAWAAALKPAKVVTHNRLTAVLEHAWWMWFEAPEAMRALEEGTLRRYELSPPEQSSVPQPR